MTGHFDKSASGQGWSSDHANSSWGSSFVLPSIGRLRLNCGFVFTWISLCGGLDGVNKPDVPGTSETVRRFVVFDEEATAPIALFCFISSICRANSRLQSTVRRFSCEEGVSV